MTYNRKRAVGDRLDLWLDRLPADAFPDRNYQLQYKNVATKLATDAHTKVEMQNILTQINAGNVAWELIIYLNNHGPGHVNQVIERVSRILRDGGGTLTAYEGYLLLMAIQFHDVGNIFGRDNHEIKAGLIMKRMGMLTGEDTCEKRVILQIAAAHGGNNRGSKDTIGEIDNDNHLKNATVRKRFIAALLRFADELADDSSRADRFSLAIGAVPPASELYHVYSKSLHSVVIAGEDVILSFEFDKDTALREFVKGDAKTYLLDEIFARTLKMHMERIYCMRFLRPHIQINRIQVKVTICETFEQDALATPIKEIRYGLEEKGYPDMPAGIAIMCPELKGITGKAVSEDILRKVTP